jgi:quinoprotein glucose dehydrogenase
MNYWASRDHSDRRLIYINAGFLTEIDARTGQTMQSFGDNGRTDLRVGLDRDASQIRPLETNNPGRVFENLIIVSLPAGGAQYDAAPADVHAYDVRAGKLAWIFHSIPRPGEFGYDTWPKDAWKTAGGVHNWNEMTVDEKRGIVYIPFGTARYDFYGANRRGADLFGNSPPGTGRGARGGRAGGDTQSQSRAAAAAETAGQPTASPATLRLTISC